jgi:hypothetical protein
MILKASMSRISTTVAATGRIAGKVTRRKICQRLAPSTMAASTVSMSWLSSAASRMMNMNGVHCQMSPTITAIRAPHGSLTQEKSPSPTAAQSGCSGPLPVSVSIRNM